MNTKIQDLKNRWDELLKQNPHLRIRNAAEQLNVSELELLATQIGQNVIVLNPEFKAILSQVQKLGKVMALTRNDQCVHERKGIYENPEFSSSHVGLFVNPDIDLRIFLNQWAFSLVVTEGSDEKQRKSLQFFDKQGQALHKIYLTQHSNVESFEALVETFRAKEQYQLFPLEPASSPKPELPDDQIDKQGFNTAWEELKDTHDFFMLLGKFKISRTQALRLAPSNYFAKPITKESIVTMLEQAVDTKTPIMVFVGNKGIIQIHTGQIFKTMWHQQWYNIMDPDFNMHLAMDKIDQAWIVRKPTVDGIVTSIEVFDKNGDIIVQFFGQRKPGIPELEQWRDIVDTLS